TSDVKQTWTASESLLNTTESAHINHYQCFLKRPCSVCIPARVVMLRALPRIICAHSYLSCVPTSYDMCFTFMNDKCLTCRPKCSRAWRYFRLRQVGPDQGSLTRYGFRDAGYPLYLHAWDGGPLLSERLSQSICEHLIFKLATHAAQQHAQATCLLYHLPTTDRECIHDTTEDQRMHIHHSASNARKGQDILHTPLNVVDQREGVPRRAGIGRQAHTVA